MKHPNEPVSQASRRPLQLAFCLTLTFAFVELAGSWWARSIALLADSAHMGMDLIALGVSLFAYSISRRPPDLKRTFGYRRIEVVSALINGIALLFFTGILLAEAYYRFVSPVHIKPMPMFIVACFGLVSNVVSGIVLYSSSKKDINVRGAFLNVAMDAFGSFGAVLAALVIIKTGWDLADDVASVVICLGIIITSYWLIRESVHILLEGAPAHLDLEQIRCALGALPGVQEVHDLHLWSLTQGSESMSGHIVIKKDQHHRAALKSATALLKTKFGLSHVTLQIEKSEP